MILAVSQGAALLFLFVVMPLLLAWVIASFVQRKSEPFPDELKTSSILRDGTPAQATLLGWKSPAQSFLDRHPMVTFRVALDGDREMEIVQAVPRALLRQCKEGARLTVRLTADGRVGAIDFAR